MGLAVLLEALKELMRISHFTDSDTALVEFSENEVFETREINENIYVDLDASGQVVSMTIEHAKTNSENWEFSYKEIPQKIA
jgi:uncharacterized protein YuzE